MGPRESSTGRELGGQMCREAQAPDQKGRRPPCAGGSLALMSQSQRKVTQGLSLDHWPSRIKPSRAASQPGEHTETSCWDSLPRPAGTRPFVQVGAHQAPPNTLPSSHLLFPKSRVWRPWVEALWSTCTAVITSQERGRSQSAAGAPSAGGHPTEAVQPSSPQLPVTRTSLQSKGSSRVN